MRIWFWFCLISSFSVSAIAKVYPTQDMKDILSNQNSRRLEQISQATVALIRTDDDNFLNPKKFGDIYKFCSEEKFLEQKLFSYCSGTLIAENKVLTAGHCIRDLKDCDQIRIAFDYFENNDIDRIKSHEIMKCKKILSWSKPVSQIQFVDYAVIELEKPVVDRKPISLNLNSKVKDHIYSMGHPLGLPMKLVQGFLNEDDHKINLFNLKSSFFKAHMSSHPGLSGSGVYNQDLELSGILVRGESNIERDGLCSRVRTCDTQDCPWVHIQKLPKLR